MNRKLLKKALEALDIIIGDAGMESYIPLYHEIEAELAKPEPDPEPVAFVADVYQSRYTIEWNNLSIFPEGTPLYATPQPERKQEFLPINTAPKDGSPVLLKVKSIEKLRGLAGIQFVGINRGNNFDWSFAAPVGFGGIPDDWLEGWMPLPLSKAQGRKPLTDDEICKILCDDGDNLNTEFVISAARAIEKEHGIT